MKIPVHSQWALSPFLSYDKEQKYIQYMLSDDCEQTHPAHIFIPTYTEYYNSFQLVT